MQVKLLVVGTSDDARIILFHQPAFISHVGRATLHSPSAALFKI